VGQQYPSTHNRTEEGCEWLQNVETVIAHKAYQEYEILQAGTRTIVEAR